METWWQAFGPFVQAGVPMKNYSVDLWVGGGFLCARVYIIACKRAALQHCNVTLIPCSIDSSIEGRTRLAREARPGVSRLPGDLLFAEKCSLPR